MTRLFLPRFQLHSRSVCGGSKDAWVQELVSWFDRKGTGLPPSPWGLSPGQPSPPHCGLCLGPLPMTPRLPVVPGARRSPLDPCSPSVTHHRCRDLCHSLPCSYLIFFWKPRHYFCFPVFYYGNLKTYIKVERLVQGTPVGPLLGVYVSSYDSSFYVFVFYVFYIVGTKYSRHKFLFYNVKFIAHNHICFSASPSVFFVINFI